MIRCSGWHNICASAHGFIVGADSQAVPISLGTASTIRLVDIHVPGCEGIQLNDLLPSGSLSIPRQKGTFKSQSTTIPRQKESANGGMSVCASVGGVWSQAPLVLNRVSCIPRKSAGIQSQSVSSGSRRARPKHIFTSLINTYLLLTIVHEPWA